MAKTEASKEPTTTTRLISCCCFAVVYLHLAVTTTTEPPSDEVKAEPPPTPDSDTVALNILPDSTFTDRDTGTSSPAGAEEEAAAAAANNGGEGELLPVMRIVQEKELGKTVIAFAIPIAIAIVTAGKETLAESETSLILILVCLGFTAILNGILLKETFPKFAQIVEPVGILLVATAFFAIVTFFLPVQTSWVPALCIVSCLLPFLIAVWQHPPT